MTGTEATPVRTRKDWDGGSTESGPAGGGSTIPRVKLRKLVQAIECGRRSVDIYACTFGEERAIGPAAAMLVRRRRPIHCSRCKGVGGDSVPVRPGALAAWRHGPAFDGPGRSGGATGARSGSRRPFVYTRRKPRGAFWNAAGFSASALRIQQAFDEAVLAAGGRARDSSLSAGNFCGIPDVTVPFAKGTGASFAAASRQGAGIRRAGGRSGAPL